MTRTDLGTELFGKGFNCAQSVFGAFCADYGLARDTALKIAGGLGSGVRAGEVCGAVSGAVLVIGLKYGHCDESEADSKATCNKKTEEFIRVFREKCGHVICRELLGRDIFTAEGREKALADNLFKTKCVTFVQEAIEILEKLGY